MNPGNSSPKGTTAGNPLLGEWNGRFGLPPFGALLPEQGSDLIAKELVR